MNKQGYIPDDPLPYQQKAIYQQIPAKMSQEHIQGVLPLQSAHINEVKSNAKRKRSILLLFAGILGLAYFAYLIAYFYRVNQSAVKELGDGIGLFAAAIAVQMVTPHIVAVGVAVLINAIAWLFNNRWLALITALSYIVAALLFLTYFLFVLPSFVLSLVSVFLIPKRERMNI